MGGYKSPAELEKKHGCFGCAGCLIPASLAVLAALSLVIHHLL